MMKPYLKSVAGRYCLLLFFLSFSSIILTPDLSSFEQASNLFFYRFNVFSIFSLLFATLSTIQTYEYNNCSVALSMAGMHSFRIMRPVLAFALTLCMFSIAVNQFFLPKAEEALGKGVFLSSFKQNHHVHKTNDGILFYKDHFQHFTFIDHAKNIVYAKEGKKTPDGFDLAYVDHFKMTNQGYSKTESNEKEFLKLVIPSYRTPKNLKTSADILTLIEAYKSTSPDIETNIPMLKVTIAYKIFMPMLHFFSVALPSLLGFSKTFRRRYSLASCTALLLTLLCFFSLECAAILGLGSFVSPDIFLLLCCTNIFVPSAFSYIYST